MRATRAVTAVLVAAALAIPLWAQFGPQMPQMRGMWHPVVGEGAAYQMQGRGGTHEMEIAVVGKEDFQGQTGYWIEMTSGEMQGHAGASKMLMVMEPPNPGVKRMIMLMNGQAYEFPMNSPMMAGRAPKAEGMDITKGGGAQKVGTETITTPAGTFECDHYRSGDPPSDVWVSSKVSPWGLVKSQSKDSTMLLTKQITDAKTKITGPVKPFDPMQMMQQQRP
jgi:hypothetical protein